MKLLDTSGANTKLAKTNRGDAYRVAGLSLMPSKALCPWALKAKCFDVCLESAGMGVFSNVKAGRQAKADFYMNDRPGFLAQLRNELANWEKLCAKKGIKPAVRLNVLSDVQWERHGIPQEFPGIFFYDYTKIANRIGKTPSNYKLMFSYSGAVDYQVAVSTAIKGDCPVAVVFRDSNFPATFLGRPVVNGDASDLDNVMAGRVIIGLKAKGKAVKGETDFIVETNIIARVAA
jgi:hypothetical protein